MRRIIPISTMELRNAWLNSLGGISSPSVKNKEWMTLLEEETRHSLMIEGYFVTKQDLQQILGGKKTGKTAKTVQEILGYFEAAVASYEFAFQQFREGEFQITKPFIRQIHALMFRGASVGFEPGAWRKGPITIAQAKVSTPDAEKVEGLIEKLIAQVNKSSAHPIRKAAATHAFFEQIHPFPDGNGRAGRILMNSILIAHGMPNIAIKGLKVEKDLYFSALESADPFVADVLNSRKPWSNTLTKPYIELEELANHSLAIAIDTVIGQRFQQKLNIDLMTIQEVAEKTGKNFESFRSACSQKKYIAIKNDGRLYSHPSLLSMPKKVQILSE